MKNMTDRYNVSKLLQVILVKKLAEETEASGKGAVVMTSLSPGLCATDLFRHVPWPISWIINLGLFLFARTPEVGARTVMTAAWHEGDTANGCYMTDCLERQFPKIMRGETGEALQKRVWDETTEILEQLEPEVVSNI
jgi:retinol dehydrogenase 12